MQGMIGVQIGQSCKRLNGIDSVEFMIIGRRLETG